MEDILHGFIADSAAIIQDQLGVVIVEQSLDIFGSFIRVRLGFQKRSDLILRCLQIRCLQQDGIDIIIFSEKRQASVLVASVVIF